MAPLHNGHGQVPKSYLEHSIAILLFIRTLTIMGALGLAGIDLDITDFA